MKKAYRFRSSRWLLSLLLLWLGAAGLFMAWHDSMTTDEGVHLASGYLALTRQDFRFDPEHPFLFKMWAALPILPLHPNPPKDDASLWAAGKPIVYDSWREARQWSEEWLYQSGNNADLMLFLGRIPAVLCLVLLGWLTYLAGKLWFSERVGLYALFFLSFNPNILANGHLIDTDAPIALVFLLTLLALWRYGQSPNWKRASLVGLALGLALLVKFSALALLPIALLWFIYVWWREKRPAFVIYQGLLTLLISWILIWVAYGGLAAWPTHYQLILDTTLPLPAQFLPYKELVDHFVLIIRWFLPIDFTKGVLLVLFSTVYGRASYLLGEIYPNGIWYYFPVLYLFKTQLIALLLLLLGVGIAVRARFWQRLRQWSPAEGLIALAFLVYAALSVKNKLDIGFRHILPLIPLISIYLARICGLPLTWLKRWWVQVLIILAYALPVLIQFPNLIGYGNVLAYPPDQRYRYFNDSNLDWGWQSRALVAEVKNHFAGQTVYCNYQWSGNALPYYGLTVKSFDPKNPPTQVILAVTATEMSYPEYKAFQGLKPIHEMENAIYFFRLDKSSQNAANLIR